MGRNFPIEKRNIFVVFDGTQRLMLQILWALIHNYIASLEIGFKLYGFPVAFSDIQIWQLTFWFVGFRYFSTVLHIKRIQWLVGLSVLKKAMWFWIAGAIKVFCDSLWYSNYFINQTFSSDLWGKYSAGASWILWL